MADTQANNEDETEQSPTQPPSGEDKGEDKGEDNGEDNANEVLWAGFSQKRMSPSRDMCLSQRRPLISPRFQLLTPLPSPHGEKEPNFAPDMSLGLMICLKPPFLGLAMAWRSSDFQEQEFLESCIYRLRAGRH